MFKEREISRKLNVKSLANANSYKKEQALTF